MQQRGPNPNAAKNKLKKKKQKNKKNEGTDFTAVTLHIIQRHGIVKYHQVICLGYKNTCIWREWYRGEMKAEGYKIGVVYKGQVLCAAQER